jgi:hypothetical protein
MKLEQQIENHFCVSDVICEYLASRGKPLLGTTDLPGIVDTWLDWSIP